MMMDWTGELTNRIGDGTIITDPADQAPFLGAWRDRYTGMAAAVVQPRTPQQVAECLAFACAHDIPVVPQAGNTGLVGGQIPVIGSVSIPAPLIFLKRTFSGGLKSFGTKPVAARSSRLNDWGVV